MAVSPNQDNCGKGGQKLMADINITPMVDVMLVLLVIFMVTAPLLIAGVHVDLPQSNAAKISHLEKPIIVTITADGGLYLGEDPADRSEIESRLRLLKDKDKAGIVYLRADRKIAYGDVVSVMGLLQHAGFQKVSLLSQAVNAGDASNRTGTSAP
jgi:biopolymer transport protein TolR